MYIQRRKKFTSSTKKRLRLEYAMLCKKRLRKKVSRGCSSTRSVYRKALSSIRSDHMRLRPYWPVESSHPVRRWIRNAKRSQSTRNLIKLKINRKELPLHLDQRRCIHITKFERPCTIVRWTRCFRLRILAKSENLRRSTLILGIGKWKNQSVFWRQWSVCGRGSQKGNINVSVFFRLVLWNWTPHSAYWDNGKAYLRWYCRYGSLSFPTAVLNQAISRQSWCFSVSNSHQDSCLCPNLA